MKFGLFFQAPEADGQTHICWFDQGNMLPRDEVERTMREFAEQVMPKLA